MTDYIQISFASLQPGQKEILIALLNREGFDGFEETEAGLDAFIPKKNYNKTVLDSITYQYRIDYNETLIKATNWNTVWESNYAPVTIENFCRVRASFHDPLLPGQGIEHEVIITPRMSFGTGHHATTCLMMKQMKAIDFKKKSVCDYGTGSGILAILAEKMGAAEILAIDNDDWSIENAKENFIQNKCTRIKIRKEESFKLNQKFDIILVNINKNIILENFSSFATALYAGGILVLCGFLAEDLIEILETASKTGLTKVNETMKDNWLSLCLHFTG